MGYQRSVVTRWKSGISPRQATLQKVADYFGVSISELVGEEEQKNPGTPEPERPNPEPEEEDGKQHILTNKKYGITLKGKGLTEDMEFVVTPIGKDDKDVHAMACLPVWKEMLEHFTPDLEKEQTHSLWQCINDASPNCRDRIVRKEVFGILMQLTRKGIWPTSYLIGIYLLPFVFYVKFIRKLVAKMSKINVARYNCCMS